MTIENRAFRRLSSAASVEMSHASFGSITVKAKDLSDGGISVNLGQHILPPIGTKLSVIIRRHSGAINQDPIMMEVRHVQPGGVVGLKFI